MSRSIRVLLTNDDGIEAPGILALERAFSALGDIELWVVAPDRGRSTSSHAMSLAHPVFVRERGERRIAVDGLPADCVYLAFYGLMERPPDVVVSGINRGANLGCDVIYSGTVACAREAVQRGVHGVAASLVEGEDYDAPARNVAEIAVAVAGRPSDRPILLNLNYPGGPFSGPRLARLGVRKYPLCVSERRTPLDDRPYYWLGGPPIEDQQVPGTDGWLIGRGVASATPLELDQTDHGELERAATDYEFVEPPEED